MLSYGGYPTIVASSKLAGWIGSNIPPSRAFEFPRLTQLHGQSPFKVIGQFLGDTTQVNTLFYPWGATRWAHCALVMDDASLDLVREQAYAGDVFTALPLVFDDDDDNVVTTDMWMQTPIPLSKFDLDDVVMQAATNDLWLVPLVDDRFFWWERSAAIVVDEGTTTWAALYAAIASALGITLTAETVGSSYLKPNRILTQYYDYLPILLDAVASSVGHRIVRSYAGTYAAMSATTALAIAAETAALGGKTAGGALQLGVSDDV